MKSNRNKSAGLVETRRNYHDLRHQKETGETLMQAINALPAITPFAFAAPQPADILAAQCLVDMIFRSSRPTNHIQQNELTQACRNDISFDPADVAGSGATNLIRNFRHQRRQRTLSDLPLFPMPLPRVEAARADIVDPDALRPDQNQCAGVNLQKATQILLQCVRKCMTERVVEIRMERLFQLSIVQESTFVPNANRVARAYRNSGASAICSPSFVYRGSLLPTLFGRARKARFETTNTPRRSNPLGEFELQPNFRHNVAERSKHFGPEKFLPNWHERSDLAGKAHAGSEASVPQPRSQASFRITSTFLPNSRRPVEIAMTMEPIWLRHSWKKTLMPSNSVASH